MTILARLLALGAAGLAMAAVGGCGNGGTGDAPTLPDNTVQGIDLEATNVTASATNNDAETTVTVFIKNSGTETITDDFFVQVTATNGRWFAAVLVFIQTDLTSGTTISAEITISLAGAVGAWTVTATADSNNDVDEVDESNNSLRRLLLTPTQPSQPDCCLLIRLFGPDTSCWHQGRSIFACDLRVLVCVWLYLLAD